MRLKYFICNLFFGNEKFKLPKYAKPVPVKAPVAVSMDPKTSSAAVYWQPAWTKRVTKSDRSIYFRNPRFRQIMVKKRRRVHRSHLWIRYARHASHQAIKKTCLCSLYGPPNLKIHYFFIKHTYGIVANGDAYETIRKTLPNGNVIKLDVGLDHQLFSRVVDKATAREATNIPLNSSCLLFVGRLVKIKNVSLLLRVLKSIQKVHANVLLVIVGDGPEVRALKSRLKFLAFRKTFILKERHQVTDLVCSSLLLTYLCFRPITIIFQMLFWKRWQWACLLLLLELVDCPRK